MNFFMDSLVEQKLPPPGTTRWTLRRKSAVIQALRLRQLTLDQVFERYGVPYEELCSWEREVGLRTIREVQVPNFNIRRWTIRRKAAVIQALRSGALTMEEACERYALSVEEMRRWQQDFDCYGVHGLRATRMQIYRSGKRATESADGD
jgi:uncharacterized protein DUF1153